MLALLLLVSNRANAPARVNRESPASPSFALVLLVSLVVGTTYWQVWAAASLAEKQDNAIQRVASSPSSAARSSARRQDGLAANRAGRSRADLLLPHVPDGGCSRRRRRLLDAGPLPHRARGSLNDYLAGTNSNLNTVIRTNARPPRHDDHGQRRRASRWTRARSGSRRARSATNCGAVVRARAGHRQGARARLEPDLRPEFAEGNFAQHPPDQGRLPPGLAARQPRQRRALTRRDRRSRSSPRRPRSTPARTRPSPRSTTRGYCIEYGKQVATRATRRARSNSAP